MKEKSGKAAEAGLHPVDALHPKFRKEDALTHREGCKWLYEQALQIGPSGLVIEVGTWCGWTAAVFALAGLRVICVDTFLMSDDFVKNPKADLLKQGRNGTLDMHALYLIELGLGERVATIQALSVDAAKAMGKEIADLIFLDADHQYDSVVADLNAWERVLKPGGIFCGDNWNSVKDVMKAVRDTWLTHLQELGWPVPDKIADDVWWMRKPIPE